MSKKIIISTLLKDSENTNHETERKAPWIISTSPFMWDMSHLEAEDGIGLMSDIWTMVTFKEYGN